MARGRLGDFGLVTVASVIAGVIGYVLTTLAAGRLGASGYALFAVFWSALYLVVGSLSGMQQEAARATRSSGSAGGRAVLVGGIPVAMAAAAAILLASSSLWSGIFPSSGRAEVAALAVGATGYVAVAIITGAMYGVGRIRVVVVIVLTDALARLVLVVTVLIVAPRSPLLPWAIVAPFLLALAVGIPFLVQSLRRGAAIDVAGRRFAVQSTIAVLSAISTSVVMSGFPAILSALVPAGAAELGTLLLMITLVRAPLMVGTLALQSFLVVHLRDQGRGAGRWAAQVGGVVAAITAALAAIGAIAGPASVHTVLGASFDVSSGLIAALVACSGLVALNVVLGALLLARSRHAWYAVGWIVVAVVSVALLALPIELSARVVVALAGGPLVGVVVQLIAARLIPVTARKAQTKAS